LSLETGLAKHQETANYVMAAVGGSSAVPVGFAVVPVVAATSAKAGVGDDVLRDSAEEMASETGALALPGATKTVEIGYAAAEASAKQCLAVQLAAETAYLEVRMSMEQSLC